MRDALAAGLCVLAAALPPGGTAQGVDVNEVVRKVQERYDATQDFTADVTQEMTIASLGKTTTARGTVAYKKPGKMRWTLTDGDPQVIVADGTTLWLYQPAERQVLKAPFDAAFRSTTPISFLTGVGRIADDFEVALVGNESTATTGEGSDGHERRLMLTPRRDRGTVGQLELTVAGDTGEIRAAEIHDPMGNVSRLRLRDIKRNVGLKDDQFVFDVPPGVDVISAPIGQ